MTQGMYVCIYLSASVSVHRFLSMNEVNCRHLKEWEGGREREREREREKRGEEGGGEKKREERWEGERRRECASE